MTEIPTQDIVVLQGVTKCFGPTEVICGVDMVCRRGETTCIVGGSGAGKTTLLRLVVALDKPTTGSIFIDGEDIAPMNERQLNHVRRKFGMVYQYAALLDSINVLDNVAFPLVEHTKLRRAEIRERVRDKLKQLDLDDTVLTKYPAELSGGMARRVALARAIVMDPEVLIYDEPFGGLDPISMGVIVRLIQSLNRLLAITTIVVSHDVREIGAIANYSYLLSEGEVVAEGTPAELNAERKGVVRQFMSGTPDGPVPFHYPAPDYTQALLSVEDP